MYRCIYNIYTVGISCELSAKLNLNYITYEVIYIQYIYIYSASDTSGSRWSVLKVLAPADMHNTQSFVVHSYSTTPRYLFGFGLRMVALRGLVVELLHQLHLQLVDAYMVTMERDWLNSRCVQTVDLKVRQSARPCAILARTDVCGCNKMAENAVDNISRAHGEEATYLKVERFGLGKADCRVNLRRGSWLGLSLN